MSGRATRRVERRSHGDASQPAAASASQPSAGPGRFAVEASRLQADRRRDATSGASGTVGAMYSARWVVRGVERRDGAVMDALTQSADDGTRGVLVVDLGGDRWRVSLSAEVPARRVVTIAEGEDVPAADAEASFAAVEDA